MNKKTQLVGSFEKAVGRLAEALDLPKTTIVRDSAVKRFELAFDLAWKTIKAQLETLGISCASPKGCFEEAYRQGLIEYQNVWLEMLEHRLETVHTYNEDTAERIFSALPKVLDALRILLASLKKT